MAETFTWRSAAPESQGMASAKLEAMRQVLAARRTKAVLVVRNDRIVLEWYAPGHGPEKPYYTASLAKALVGGMALMVALNDGRIGVDDPAWKYIAAWKDDPVKAKITIRQLATHTSGIADAEDGGRPHEELTGWKGDFWKQRPDPFSISLRQAPVAFEPTRPTPTATPARRHWRTA
jgi:CubicO group peptidase (beta-lactamase class C family)